MPDSQALDRWVHRMTYSNTHTTQAQNLHINQVLGLENIIFQQTH